MVLHVMNCFQQGSHELGRTQAVSGKGGEKGEKGEKRPGSINSQQQLALPRIIGGRRLLPLPRPTPPTRLPPLAGHRFYVPIASIVTDGLILVEGEAQIGDGFVVEGATEKVAICGAPRVVVSTEGEVEWMRRHQHVRLSERVGAVAGPAVVGVTP
jgi:hypothetical protein